MHLGRLQTCLMPRVRVLWSVWSPQWHQGQEWDFVFDVDISDNAPPLQLPCNADENPYIVADRFLQANELPPGYKDQVKPTGSQHQHGQES